MSDVLKFLQQRNSAPRLCAPGPDAAQVEGLLQAALRVPDHAWLQPWRFNVITGAGRDRLGQVFVDALLANDPLAAAAAQDKARAAPLRAPVLIVVSCLVQPHPKVPRDEQLLSAGCAAHSILLAAEAMGYAGVWRTGSYATDHTVKTALEHEPSQEIVAFLYLGSRDSEAKQLPLREVDNYVKYWNQ
ncbi:nitroreductase [Halieaceae bacterium IMCC14734]|uniref:Putative NAD(P)H nitroreductase n=1 Tax=Candidatus Litorirhabdus singularis TaxID=2518993 RepID=A0ABT3THB5_9GAMM|nr:nitroreductase [Candidatus Litorirhabdus singularis]MCX2981717.1 nitroreductase [Candidatus Litorirhabdus singularis]